MGGGLALCVKAPNIIFNKDDDGKWIEDPEQPTKLKCDFVISAFGSGLYDNKVIIFGSGIYDNKVIILQLFCRW